MLLNIRANGGGGYGIPTRRDPEKVLADVRNGYVSIEQALKVYRVAIDPRKGRVDWGRTKRLRASKSAQGTGARTRSRVKGAPQTQSSRKKTSRQRAAARR